MLNLQICTVLIMTKKHKKINEKKIKKKKSCETRDSNRGHMGPKVTKISITLWRPIHITDKNNQYMLKL